MPYSYKIHPRVYNEIDTFYENVANKYCHTYSYALMCKGINDAYDANYHIEGDLIRRKPTLTRWTGLFMASYKVDGKTRWNYAYRTEGNNIFVEDACHAQNMSEFTSKRPTTKIKYRKVTTKPLFGYKFVRNDKGNIIF